jgi:hypothetical protein
MAICKDCKQEMTKNLPCTYPDILIDGKWYDRITIKSCYGDTCHDCAIPNVKGNLHHFGCDMEQCPKCGGQLISCDCHKEAIGKAI